MERSIYQQLKAWKDSEHRKPLMLYGARQVGKTYILREFGRREYDNLIYINCYKNAEVAKLFETDKDIRHIQLGLSAISKEVITPGTHPNLYGRGSGSAGSRGCTEVLL